MFFDEVFLNENYDLYHDLSFIIPFNHMLNSPVLSLKDKDNFNTIKSLCTHIYNEFNASDSEYKIKIIQSHLRAILLKANALIEPKFVEKDHGDH